VAVLLTAAWKDTPSVCCHLGAPHYLENNLRARSRAHAINLMLEDFGLQPEFRLGWIAASEGSRFAEVITEVAEQARKPGPSTYRTQ